MRSPLAQPFEVITFREIIDNALGHPDIYGYPCRLNVDAIPPTSCITSPTVTDEGAGRAFGWMVEAAAEWWDEEE